MMFAMEEFWNDNLNEGIMADIIMGIGTTAHKTQDERRKKSDSFISSTDRIVKHCKKCDRLWEHLRSQNKNYTVYVPKCNSVKIGKKEMVCQKCNK